MYEKEKDPLFLGLTRPVLIFGMPYVYFWFLLVGGMVFYLLTLELVVSALVGVVGYFIGLYLGKSDPFMTEIWRVTKWKTPKVRNFNHWKSNSYRP